MSCDATQGNNKREAVPWISRWAWRWRKLERRRNISYLFVNRKFVKTERQRDRFRVYVPKGLHSRVFSVYECVSDVIRGGCLPNGGERCWQEATVQHFVNGDESTPGDIHHHFLPLLMILSTLRHKTTLWMSDAVIIYLFLLLLS